MPTRDIIVIGASAGGVQALITLVADLTVDLPAAVFVVRAALFERRTQEAETNSSTIRRLLLAGEKGDIGNPYCMLATIKQPA